MSYSGAIIFDFDKTLMKKHWWGMYRDTPLNQIPKSNIDDFSYNGIEQAFKYFNFKNFAICIASFGRKDVINKILTENNLKKYVKIVSTPGDYDGINNGSIN